MSDDKDQRLSDLEIALTHQQQELDALSSVVHQQWAEIEKLKSEIKRLEDRKADRPSDEEEANVRPPHY